MGNILVSDYDRTFYINDDEIIDNINAISKWRCNENYFVIATGRAYESIKKEIDKFNIKYDYLIIEHGACILDNKGNIIKSYIIDDGILKSIKKYFKENKYDKHIISCENKYTYLDSDRITRIHIAYTKAEELKYNFNKFNDIYVNKVNCYLVEFDLGFEIVSIDTNKSIAIRYLLNVLNINNKNVFVIGDSINDIPMIKEFNGYCVENAKDVVKNISSKSFVSVKECVKYIQGCA